MTELVHFRLIQVFQQPARAENIFFDYTRINVPGP